MSHAKETYKPLSSKEKHALIKAIETGDIAKLFSYTTQQLLQFKDRNLNNLIHLAMQQPNHKVLTHLVSIGTHQNEPLFAHTSSTETFQFYQALLLNNQILVKKMLQKNPHYLDLIDAFGFSPIHYAAMLGLMEMTDLLHSHNRIKKDAKGCNSLHLAVQFGHKDLVSKFFKTEFYNQDDRGNTPLHYAVMYNRIDIAKILLAKLSATELLTKNAALQSALHLAIHQGNDEAIQLIINQYHQKFKYPHEKSLIHDIYYAYYQAITKSSRCRIVDVSRLKLTDDEFLILLPKIMQSSSLKVINISHNHLTRKSIKQLCSYFASIEIETIIADGNDLSDWLLASGSKMLANALSKTHSLKSLSLKECGLTDADMQSIAQLIATNRELHHLDLRQNPQLTEKGVQVLLDVLKTHVHNVSRINLDKRFDANLGKQIQAQLESKREERMSPDLFLNILHDLKQLLPQDLPKIDDKTKQALLKKQELNSLTKSDALQLFARLLDDEVQTYKASSLTFKDVMSYHSLQQDLSALIKSSESKPEEGESLSLLKKHLDAQSPKIVKQEQAIEDDTQHKQRKQLSQTRISHFENTLQRKLSMYWFTANCLETQLIEASSTKELEKTLGRIHILLALLSLLPGISHAHHAAHGLLGAFEKIVESFCELVESIHVIEFLSEMPGIHHIFHVAAETWQSLGAMKPEQMLKNLIHAFEDLETCNEACTSLVKAISHCYEDQLGRLDSQLDAERLAVFTATMILDFLKMGLYQQSENKTESLLYWIFFTGKVHYESLKQKKELQFIHISNGKKIKPTEVYYLPGLEFQAKDVNNQTVSIKCDMEIKASKDRDKIKTSSPVMGHRKGSKLEAKEFQRQIKDAQDKHMSHEQEQAEKASHYIVTFDQKSLDEGQNFTQIDSIPFEFKTKTQRLKKAEETIIDLQNNIKLLENKYTEVLKKQEEQEECILHIQEHLKQLKNSEDTTKNKKDNIQAPLPNQTIRSTTPLVYSVNQTHGNPAFFNNHGNLSTQQINNPSILGNNEMDQSDTTEENSFN